MIYGSLGSLTSCWSDPGGFYETYTDRDMIFYTETHESPERGLPTVTGYLWESAHSRKDTRVRGSEGVAVVFRAHLRPVISIAWTEEHACHMWIRVCFLDAPLLFLAVCYFPLDTSSYARQVTTEGHSPYEPLYADITDFTRESDAIKQ